MSETDDSRDAFKEKVKAERGLTQRSHDDPFPDWEADDIVTGQQGGLNQVVCGALLGASVCYAFTNQDHSPLVIGAALALASSALFHIATNYVDAVTSWRDRKEILQHKIYHRPDEPKPK